MKWFLRGLLVTSVAATVNNTYFQQRSEIFSAHEVIHMSLDFDYRPILAQCDEFRIALRNVSKGFDDAYLSAVWFSAAAMVQTSCDFDHIWPGESTRTKPTITRERRQLMPGLAIFGTLFGLYNWNTIHQLSGRVDRLEHHLRRDLVILEHHETRMEKLEADVVMINKTLGGLIRNFQGEERQIRKAFWMQDFHLQLSVLQEHIVACRSGWTALHAQRLPVEWISAKQLTTVFRRLEFNAQKMGGVLPIEHRMDLFDLPTSFIWIKDVVRVFVHIPVVKEAMHLYEYLRIPIRLNGTFIQLKPDREFIMVGAGNRVHQEITGVELRNKCHRLGAYYMCEDLGVLLRKMDHTCLGSLFSNNLPAITEKCSMERMARDWEVFQVGHNLFMVFVQTTRNLMVECRNGTRRNQLLQLGTQQVQLEDTCLTYTTDFELRPSTLTAVRLTVVQEVNWETSSLSRMWIQMQEGSNATEDLLGSLSNLSVSTEEERQRDRELLHSEERWLDYAIARHSLAWPLVISCILCIGLVIAIVGYLYWRFRSIQRTDPGGGTTS
jgi:hypothetical protein